MEARVLAHLETLLTRWPELISVREALEQGYAILEGCFSNGGKLLIAGNGGSSADAQHMVGELMKAFAKPRPVDPAYACALESVDGSRGAVLAQNLEGALPAIALDGHPALTTAYMNDRDPLLCFAQQVHGYGRPGDVFLGISTSGNSENVLYAAVAAKARGMKVLGLTGEMESSLSAAADVCIRVPRRQTHLVQELHLPVYHALCLMLEERFFGI